MLKTITGLSQWNSLLGEIQLPLVQAETESLGLVRAARFPVVAALRQALNRPILYLTEKPSLAALAMDEIAFWTPGSPFQLFPAPDPLFYEPGDWEVPTRANRINVLTTLAGLRIPGTAAEHVNPFLIVPIRALMAKTIDARTFLKSIRTLRVNQQVNPDYLIRNWVEVGYEATEIVVEPGKFSKRGGLLDIWPLSEMQPARIDFFGDEIDTIHFFDPATQRNLEAIEKLRIPPAKEIFLSQTKSLNISNEKISEYLIPLCTPEPQSLLDYLPEDTLVVTDDWLMMKTHAEDIEEQAEKLRAQSLAEGILEERFPEPYFSFSEIEDRLTSFRRVNLGRSENGVIHPFGECFEPAERFGGKTNDLLDFLLDKYLNQEKVTVVSRQNQRLQLLWKNLEAMTEAESEPDFIPGTIHEGFHVRGSAQHSAWLLTDSEIFGWERPLPRKPQVHAADVPEKYFADLKPGDFVVHVDYGVGRYVGLVSRTIEHVTREFLCIEYDKGDQLFVPVHQADRLTNYIGPDGRDPDLTRLGTQEWLNVKQHVREKVVEIAQDLLDLYAKRQVSQGFAFSADTVWQQDMEGSFPYFETEDQKLAISQVKADMERPRPMDRLICGDVGFGKTEVALRAAFKASCDNKQVAILVPTTVLAQQHYETFKQRFSAFPLSVEMLSRFRTAKEQEAILKKLANGSIDIIIGTHRLVSRDVEFKDLGLIIIDEEQRFGVAQKEYLKKLRTEVDVLTMTATPIPRTLYMALTGVRDISSINTPPDERVPVVTHVGPYSDKLVRQAILRELERDGQVFFVHNRVQSIYAMGQHLRALVPEARFGIGHGQLPEKELSKVMDAFYNHEIDVLLSTSIIESGLDVPNANTLIADRADMLGLAQLYQIRGRVGRSAQRAYAYFFQQRNHKPTDEGLERLEVIAENTQLGAGYSIAMRDLEMRGAGEILGSRQHGSIASVGFHLYTRLLAQAVKNVRQIRGMEENLPQENGMEDMALQFNPVTVELPLNVGIPEDYIREQKTRIKLYRRLASVRSELELKALMDEFAERFGPVPESVENLFFQIQLKILAEKIGLVGVLREGGSIVLRYPPLPAGIESRSLPELGAGIRSGKNAYWLTGVDFGGDSWKQTLFKVLNWILMK